MITSIFLMFQLPIAKPQQSKELKVAWKMGFTKLISDSSFNTEFEDSEFNLTTLLDNHNVNKLNFAKSMHINQLKQEEPWNKM